MVTHCPNCNYFLSGLSICKSCGYKEPEVQKVYRIAKRSAKRQKQESEYNTIRKQFLIDHPKCAIYPRERSTEVHHMKGRVGELLTDTRYFLAVSRKAHALIEANPEWAKEHGYSLSRLENEGID